MELLGFIRPVNLTQQVADMYGSSMEIIKWGSASMKLGNSNTMAEMYSHCATSSRCCIVTQADVLDLDQIPWIILQLGCIYAKNFTDCPFICRKLFWSLVVLLVMWQSLHLGILFLL
jgi:hypothetical protein